MKNVLLSVMALTVTAPAAGQESRFTLADLVFQAPVWGVPANPPPPLFDTLAGLFLVGSGSPLTQPAFITKGTWAALALVPVNPSTVIGEGLPVQPAFGQGLQGQGSDADNPALFSPLVAEPGSPQVPYDMGQPQPAAPVPGETQGLPPRSDTQSGWGYDPNGGQGG